MARLLTCGFELGTNDLAEFIAVNNNPTIQSTMRRSGAYAGKILTPTSGTPRYWEMSWKTDLVGPVYFRFYIKVVTAPNAGNQIFKVLSDLSNNVGSLALNTGGNLTMQRSDGTGIGVGSADLRDGNWHRVEMLFDKSGSNGTHVMRCRVDGSEFTAVTNLTLAWNMSRIRLGVNLESGSASSGEWYYDDIAVNNGDGSVNNSYPGEGRIACIRPDSAGDVNDWDDGGGGTPGGANNYTRVNEISPDGDTSHNSSLTAGEEDFFNCQRCVDVGIRNDATINWLGVGGYYKHEVSGASGTIKWGVMKTSGGTKGLSSAGQSFASTAYKGIGGSNNNQRYTDGTQGRNDPDGSQWTPATIDTMQIGYKLDTAGANRSRISAVWAMVEYVASLGEKSYGYVY